MDSCLYKLACKIAAEDKQMVEGEKVEHEHHDTLVSLIKKVNPHISEEKIKELLPAAYRSIAGDHTSEISDYYVPWLKNMEAKAKAAQGKKEAAWGISPLAKKMMIGGGIGALTQGAMSNDEDRLRNMFLGGAMGAGLGYGYHNIRRNAVNDFTTRAKQMRKSYMTNMNKQTANAFSNPMDSYSNSMTGV